MNTLQRMKTLANKMDSASKLMAVVGLASANKGNPFISKSDAMKRINEVRIYQKKLSSAKMLNDVLWSVVV